METAGKLPFKVKLTFAIGDMGKNCLILLNTYFLLYFYTDVVQISPGIAATIMLIARIWDAINDPMMGVLVDKTVSKEGKCRFYLKYFSVPAGVCLALTYFVPELSVGGKIVWVAITYIFQGMLTTITSVPLNALLARLTDNRLEKVSLGQYKAVGSMVANLVIPAVTLPLVTFFGGMNMTRGFGIVGAIYGVMYAACHLITWYGTKGYEKVEVSEVMGGSHPQTTSVRDLLGAVAKNKICIIVSFSYILYLLYASLMGSTLVYYLQYNLQNTDLMAVYSIIGTASAIVPILMMKVLSAKLGNAKTCAYACVLVVIGYIIRYVTKDQYTALLYVCWAIEGVGLGIFGSLIFQCILDSIIYGKWKTGVDTEGVVMSVFTFAQKGGQALGGVIAAYLLQLVSYEANAATQNQTVLNLFFAENITIPAVIFACIFFVFLYIARFEKKIPIMQQEIAEREKLNA